MMKNLLLSVLLLVMGSTLTAQNLTTHREYYDWFGTMIKYKWTTRPDGVKHGDFISYRENGSISLVENYTNGKYSGFKKLFQDGTVASTGKVIVKSNMNCYNTCKEYSYYTISNSGKRTLRMQSRLYQQTKQDSLGDYTINRDLGWGNSRTCFMYDYRLESYSQYHANGKIALRFSVSPDRNLETIMQYDENGKLVGHQVYNVKEQKLSYVLRDFNESAYTIRNGVVTINRDIEKKAENGIIYTYKAGSTFYNTISLHLSRKEFYDEILTLVEDDYTENYAVQVNGLVSLDLDLGERILDLEKLQDKDVKKEQVGRALKMKLEWPDVYESWWKMDEILQVVDTRNPKLYCLTNETAKTKEYIKATFEQDSLIYLDCLLTYKGTSRLYQYQCGIKNLKPNGQALFKLSYDNGETATWEGEARDGYFTEGECISQQPGSIERITKGTWKNNKFDSGLIKETANKIDTLYAYYKDGKADGRTLYKSGKTGASFETLSPITLESPGQGVYIAPNNDRYEGLFTSNDISGGELSLHHFVKGKAECKLENGDVYKGECTTAGLFSTKIVFEGIGHLIKPNGDYYKGVFSKGKFTGNGEVRITDKSNKTYEGEYQNNLPNGVGKLVYPTGSILSGNFKMGVPYDQCEIQYANGDLYQGLVSNELPNGQGCCTYQNGNVYVGQWAQGMRQGAGKLTTSANVSYEGLWKADKLNGEISIVNGGDHYKISYKMGVVGKVASAQFENGDKFEGQIENGNYKLGEYIFKDGMIYSGSWIDGKPAKVKVTDAQGVKVSTKEPCQYRQVCTIDKNLLNVQ